jgi:hypothetical protein
VIVLIPGRLGATHRRAGTGPVPQAAALLIAVLLVAGCSSSPPPPTAPLTSAPAATPSPGPPASPAATPAPAAPAAFTPVIGSVLRPPIPVTATDGQVHLVYELTLTSAVAQPIVVRGVRAVAGSRTLRELGGDLGQWFTVLGNPGAGTTLPPGGTALTWIDVAVATQDEVPGRIDHVIDLQLSQPQPPLLPATLSETIAPVTVQRSAPAVIASPLDGPGWLDGNGCCSLTPHRAALNPLNGQLWGAERFAIDFVRLTPDGKVFTGDKTRLESYPYYGAPIHAVADGPVVAVVDGLPEQPPGASPTGLPLDQYGGNHVVQDIGNGLYAFYAHLQTGSASRVRVGQPLRTGDVLGLLGNTGNTDAPHLHFHLMDGTDPLVSNGVPYEFRSFERTGRVASPAVLDQMIDGAPAQYQGGLPAGPHTEQLPLWLDVLTFPEVR